MSLSHGSLATWLLAILGACIIGLVKGGLNGVNLIPVLIFAFVFPAKESTGLVLPLLIVGDICAVRAYYRSVSWAIFWRFLPLCALGVVLGYFLMNRLPTSIFRPVIGGLILLLLLVQLLRQWTGPTLDALFQGRFFSSVMGLLTGVTTMLANAAGPFATLYFVSIALPKWIFISTYAFLFFVINLIKLPFSAAQGLINPLSLSLGLVLAPFVIAGFFAGRALADRFSEQGYQAFLLIFTGLAALMLLWP